LISEQRSRFIHLSQRLYFFRLRLRLTKDPYSFLFRRGDLLLRDDRFRRFKNDRSWLGLLNFLLFQSRSLCLRNSG